ncbi:MAG: hypothetical protein ACFB0B_18160 [Thermonemataceae bacterium]
MNDLNKYVALAVEDCATYPPLALQKRAKETVEEKALAYLFAQYEQGIEVTDEMLCEYIYAHREVRKATFIKLKSRVIEKLRNNLLFYEYPEENKLKVVAEAHKLYLQGVSAGASGFDKQARDILLLCIATCEQCEEYGIATQAASFISGFTSLYDRTNVKKYIEAMEKYVYLEYEKQKLYIKRKLIGYQTKSTNNRAKFLSSIDKQIEEAYNTWKKTGLSTAWLLYIRFVSTKSESFGGSRKTAALMRKTRTMLKQGQLKESVVKTIYTHYAESLACLMHRDIKTGLKSVQQGLTHFKKYKMNWYVMQVHHILLLFHARKYAKVADVLDEVMRNRLAFESQFPKGIGQFKLFKAYICILLPKRWQTKLDYDQFYAESLELRRDKKGLNFWLLLLEILWAAQKGDWDRMDRRVTALIAYKKRWTKSKRIRAFVYILAYVAQHNYQPRKPKKAIREKLAMLRTTDLDPLTQAYPDILPLEDVYELLVTLLERKSTAITSVTKNEALQQEALEEYDTYSKL